MLYQNLFEAIAESIASKVASKLGSKPNEYNTATLPAGVTRRTFARRCTGIAEARHEGRLWRCPVEAWHASFTNADATADAYGQAVSKAGARW
jgi:hypothetical protein